MTSTPGAADAASSDRCPDSLDVIVVGAGQAGLAMGHALARRGLRFLIIERAPAVGQAWRERWNSLVLFTPARYSALPGMPFPGDADHYPTRDEVISYLERYAERFELPVALGRGVDSVRPRDDGYVVAAGEVEYEADEVVVATGPFQVPRVPAAAERLGLGVVQMHSTGYRGPADLPAGTALVVGGGNTGVQIAEELSRTHEAHLAVGSRQTPLPQRLLGRDLFWWLTKAGILNKNIESRLGRKLSTRDTLIGSSPRELKRQYGVEMKPRAVDADGRTVRFEDGSELEVDAVIWATGYRPDYSWIKLPIFDEGRLRHRRGVTDVPGLCFLGLTWQYTRGSALIGWVKDDAEFIAEQIAEYQQSKAPPAAETPVGVGAPAQGRRPERM
jgi:putative flavoprotein involved in K+ transport